MTLPTRSDAQSVECGIGPVCREKAGIPDKLGEEARAEANRLVYEIAARQHDCPEVRAALGRLAALGCDALVVAIRKRIYGDPIEIHVSDEGRLLSVKSPYNASAVDRMRSVRGRKWDAENKVNVFPNAAFDDLVRIFNDCYPGQPVKGPSGSVTAGESITREMLGIPAAVGPASIPDRVAIRILVERDRFAIWAPYSEGLAGFMRSLPERRWYGHCKANVLPLHAKECTLDCVRRLWPNAKIVEETGSIPEPPARRGRLYNRSRAVAQERRTTWDWSGGVR